MAIEWLLDHSRSFWRNQPSREQLASPFVPRFCRFTRQTIHRHEGGRASTIAAGVAESAGDTRQPVHCDRVQRSSFFFFFFRGNENLLLDLPFRRITTPRRWSIINDFYASSMLIDPMLLDNNSNS